MNNRIAAMKKSWTNGRAIRTRVALRHCWHSLTHCGWLACGFSLSLSLSTVSISSVYVYIHFICIKTMPISSLRYRRGYRVSECQVSFLHRRIAFVLFDSMSPSHQPRTHSIAKSLLVVVRKKSKELDQNRSVLITAHACAATWILVFVRLVLRQHTANILRKYNSIYAMIEPWCDLKTSIK